MKNFYWKDFHTLITKILAYGQFLGEMTQTNENTKKNTIDNFFPNFKPGFAFDLPFDEALKYFRSLDITTPDKFYENVKNYSGIAFTISKITSEKTLSAVKKEFAKNLAKKLDPQKLKEKIRTIAEKRGETKLSHFHLQTIVQTNLQTAFSKGNYLKLRENKKPFWQYIAIDDNRTTPLCASLDMKVFQSDDPFWDTYYPPNHFNCRSTVVALDEHELEAEKLSVIPPDIVHTPHTPGPGFTVSPDKGLEKFIRKTAADMNIPYKDKMHPPLNSEKETIAYWQQQIMNISNNEFEIAAAVDNNFNLIHDKTGKSNIRFSQAELEKIKNANLMIHNHPNNTVFSDSDIKFMIEQNIKSMVILNEDKYYKISDIKIDYKTYEEKWIQFYIDNENLFHKMVVDNNRDYKEAYNEIKRRFFRKLKNEKSIRMVQKTVEKG